MSRRISINFVGDVMLGRLIDQLLPVHVNEPSEARIISSFLNSNPHLRQYNPGSPWGDTLPLFNGSDLNIINLETAVTSSSKKWPNKVFNYRMHPENISALKVANVSYASLANNHTLDFSEEGLRDTVEALENAGIAFAGAGLGQKEAAAPVVISLATKSESNDQSKSPVLKIWAAADHPSSWSELPGFSFIDYTPGTRRRLKRLIAETSGLDPLSSSTLKIFSVHWGPNYSWKPSEDIRSLAHFPIDECGIDIIHGHSPHHVQGVEIYKDKLIIYGCGDFVDDYALTPEYRNDLSAVWRLNVIEDNLKLELDKLEIFPTRINAFQAQRLTATEADFIWFQEKLRTLCRELGTTVEPELSADSQLTIKLRSNNDRVSAER